jgi:hypothetical protein
MFTGRNDEARALYLGYRSTEITPERLGQELILEDFASPRRVGLTSPLMDEIEAVLTGSVHAAESDNVLT